MSSTDLLARTEANLASVEKIYKQILAEDSSTADAQLLRDKETALVKLGELYRDQKGAKSLAGVISLFYYIHVFHGQSTPKILYSSHYIQRAYGFITALLKDNTAWAKAEKRIFLKHSLETRLVSLQLESQQFKLALMLIDNLLTELTCLDDKMILIEVHAALTSSRTAANSIYCSLTLQASLDLQSGILHTEDKDYTITYSYFFEALENLSSQGDDGALDA
ncbi:26S proteasome non-ATPase regulatory subunit 11B [Leucoagaricus sp. SymC.cos]|nr:26S proteasome non-ATPase regulatory subunit 11B [Leucoagaricus sp. SymC.cos]